MSTKTINEQELATILSQLSSVDAQDTLILKLLENGRKLPESYIRETACHLLQKHPLLSAKLYLMAKKPREAFNIYLKTGDIDEATKIIEDEKNGFTILERYSFYEAQGEYYKATNLAGKEKDKKREELYDCILEYFSTQ